VLARLAHILPYLGQVKVFEPQIFSCEVQLLHQFLLLLLGDQEVREQSAEGFLVFAVGLQGLFVELDSAVLIFQVLVCLGQQQESLSELEGSRLVFLSHAALVRCLFRQRSHLKDCLVLAGVFFQHTDARLRIARTQQGLSHEDAELQATVDQVMIF